MNIIDEYLVSLGFQTNAVELRKFDEGLKTAEGMVDRATFGIAKDLFKWQAKIVGAFTAISGSIIGLADHVAQQDQDFRLLGLSMFTTTENARTLKTAMEALGGVTLGQIAWDPELHRRFLQLRDDQELLTKQLGPTFEQNMVAIRDFRFEITRLHVAFQYLSMAFVGSLFTKLRPEIEAVQAKLTEWVNYVREHLPEIADNFANYAIPILQDTWKLLVEIGGAIKEFGVLFTNVVGLFSHDTAIQGTTFSFENLAQAIEHATGWLASFASSMTSTEKLLVHFVDAITLVLAGRLGDAKKELEATFEGLSPGSGAIIGGVLGSFVTPVIGTAVGAAIGGIAGKTAETLGPHDVAASVPTDPVAARVVRAANILGIDPSLALSVAKQESGIRQFDASGRLITSPGAGALGVMQLMPQTAAGLGVNPRDTDENITGGLTYLKQLFVKYHDWTKALEAYNEGPGNLDRQLGTGRAIPTDVQHYAASILGRVQGMDLSANGNLAKALKDQGNQMGQMAFAAAPPSRSNGGSATAAAPSIHVDKVEIHITEPNATPQQIQESVTKGFSAALSPRGPWQDLAQLSPG